MKRWLKNLFRWAILGAPWESAFVYYSNERLASLKKRLAANVAADEALLRQQRLRANVETHNAVDFYGAYTMNGS